MSVESSYLMALQIWLDSDWLLVFRLLCGWFLKSIYSWYISWSIILGVLQSRSSSSYSFFLLQLSTTSADIMWRSPRLELKKTKKQGVFPGDLRYIRSSWDSEKIHIGFSDAAVTLVSHCCPVHQRSAPSHWSELTGALKLLSLGSWTSSYRLAGHQDSKASKLIFTCKGTNTKSAVLAVGAFIK